MPLAPVLNVRPGEFLALYADDSTHIFTILCAPPPQLPNDHVLGGWEKHLPATYDHGLATPKPFLVVWVFRQSEDLDLKHRPCNTKLLPLRARVRFEGQLWFRLELRAKKPPEFLKLFLAAMRNRSK